MVPFHCFPANVLCSPPTMMSSSYADKITAAEKDSIMHVFSLTCDWLCSGNWWSSSYACTRPRQWTHHGQRQVCAEKAWSYMGDPHKQPRKCAAHTQCCLGEFVIFFRLGRGAPFALVCTAFLSELQKKIFGRSCDTVTYLTVYHQCSSAVHDSAS